MHSWSASIAPWHLKRESKMQFVCGKHSKLNQYRLLCRRPGIALPGDFGHARDEFTGLRLDEFAELREFRFDLCHFGRVGRLRFRFRSNETYRLRAGGCCANNPPQATVTVAIRTTVRVFSLVIHMGSILFG